MNCSTLRSDVIVVGSGGAGAMAALAAASSGSKVLMLTSNTIGRGGLTPTGNGGYVAPLHPKDDPENLFKHLVRFGYYLNDQNLVYTMVTEAVPSLKRLEALGVNVRWPALKEEGPYPRALLVPGTDVLGVLRRNIRSNPDIKVMEDVVVTKLLTHKDAIAGCCGYDGRSGRFFVALSKALVLATGGMGELWSAGSNMPMGIPTGSYGSGYALAAGIGAEMIDMEQIQFVPIPARPRIVRNVRYLPNGPYSNAKGEPFLEKDGLDPYSVELVTAVREQEKEAGGPVKIDLTGSEMPSYGVSSAHPQFLRKLKLFEDLGVTPWQQPVEIAIGSHYCQGGVHVDETCASNVPGFFAAGEVAGGVMGASRAGGAAFTDIIVFGWRAGESAAKYASREHSLPLSTVASPTPSVIGVPAPSKGGVRAREFVKELNKLMDDYCGDVRDGPGLEKCLAGLGTLKASLDRMETPEPGVFDLRYQDAIAVEPMIQSAEMVVRSAIARTETLGSHVRLDCPNRPTWPVHTTMRKEGEGFALGTKPVVVKWLKPGE